MKAADIKKQTVDKFTRASLRVYGSYVVEERAVPDYRDGLKPSHRAVVWAMHGLGVRSNTKHVKAARVVGDAIGRYHPHGDSSVYGAMVTLANSSVPLVDGQGNWGSPVASEAAYRYTEARMSKFTDMFVLNKEYLQVVPYIDNYSGTEKYPLYLPALLPFLLMNGSAPIPAYGVSAGNPAFSINSIAKVVERGLKGHKITAKYLAKTLDPVHEYGCDVVADKTYPEIMATGRGSLVHQALVSCDDKSPKIIISSFVPKALASLESCERTMNAIAALPGVKRAYSQQGKRTKGSGPYGACFVVETKALREPEFQALLQKVKEKVTATVGVRLGVTVRHADKPNSFHYLSFVQLFKAWLKYRVDLEVRLLNQQIKDVEEKIHVNEVYLWAVDNLDALLEALRTVLRQKDPTSALAKRFKMPIDDANIILKRQVIQLSRLERDDLTATLKELRGLLKSYRQGLKEPGAYAAAKTHDMMRKYNKSPDVPRCGVSFSQH